MSPVPLMSAGDLTVAAIGDDMALLRGRHDGDEIAIVYGSPARLAQRLRHIADELTLSTLGDDEEMRHATLIHAGDLVVGDRVCADTHHDASPPAATSSRWATVVRSAPMSSRTPVLTVELDAPYRRLRIWSPDRLVWTLRPVVADVTTEAAA